MFATFTQGVQPCRSDEYVLLLNNLAISTGSHCRPEGSWMNISMDFCTCLQNVSMVCRCFQQWSVEHSYTHRPDSGRPRSTDPRQDRCIVLAAVAAQTATTEEIWAHVALLARLSLISRHHQAQLLWCHERVNWIVEWHSVVFSDENGFVCV